MPQSGSCRQDPGPRFEKPAGGGLASGMQAGDVTGASASSARDDPDQFDRMLMEGIRNQSHPAMKTFYEQYKGRVIPFLFRLTKNQQIIEEAYNDLMFQVWQKAGQFKGESKVSSWVFTIAYRSCLRILKREQKHNNKADEPENEPAVEMSDNDRTLQAAIDILSPKHRLVVELYYLEGYTLDDIANITRSPINTIKTRLHYARKKLAQVIQGQGEKQ